MGWRRLSMGVMAITAFADRRRLGVEFSVPSPRFWRSGSGSEPGFAIQKVNAAKVLRSDASLAERVAALTWYHTIDLGGGVVTPGFVDHRLQLPLYRIPKLLDGQRVLDVAKFDGFWAFEFERRKAAEVIALDIREARELDLPFRVRSKASQEDLSRSFSAGFDLARSALGSNVIDLHCNVYDLDPAQHGQFDLTHCGDLLVHLRDPALALARIRSVTRGMAIISEIIFPDCDRLPGVPLIEYQGGRGENIWWRFGALRHLAE